MSGVRNQKDKKDTDFDESAGESEGYTNMVK